jgi:tRNA threonylcarbamoyladenosine biosynthesis protein TsaB
MNLLAVDCALDACQIAVLRGGGVIERIARMRQGHAEAVAGLAATAMAEAGLSFAALDRIAVTVGPGSFAGVRIGLAFARGLAVALEKPCLGFSTLEIFARAMGDDGLRAGVIPAPDGVFLGQWRDGLSARAPARMGLDAARAVLAAEPCQVHGPGAALVGGQFGQDIPSIETLAQLAARAEPTSRPPNPLYLRPPYATLPEA